MNDKPKILNAIQFEAMFPEVQSRLGRFSQLTTKTFNVPISSGTANLPNKGDIALQNNGGTIVLAVCIAPGTTVFYNPAGVL